MRLPCAICAEVLRHLSDKPENSRAPIVVDSMEFWSLLDGVPCFRKEFEIRYVLIVIELVIFE